MMFPFQILTINHKNLKRKHEVILRQNNFMFPSTRNARLCFLFKFTKFTILFLSFNSSLDDVISSLFNKCLWFYNITKFILKNGYRLKKIVKHKISRTW